MSHAYAFLSGGISQQTAFLKAAGWQLPNPEIDIGADKKEIEDQNNDIKDALNKKDLRQAIEIQKEYDRKFGLPTLYSMANPAESFAEAVTWSFHDKEAESYLRKDLAEFLKSQIVN